MKCLKCEGNTEHKFHVRKCDKCQISYYLNSDNSLFSLYVYKNEFGGLLLYWHEGIANFDPLNKQVELKCDAKTAIKKLNNILTIL